MTAEPNLVDEPTRGGVIRWAKLYDKAVGVISLGREAQMRSETLRHANLTPGECVLDVGCGTGTLAIGAAKEGASVTAIDPAANMIRRAREKAKASSQAVAFEVGVAERLDFDDAEFDAVLCSLVLHHLPPSMQKDCLAEMLRVLKPGGRLVLVDFSGPGPLLHRVGALFRSHEHEHERSDGLTQCLLQLGFEQPARHPMNPSYLFCLIAKKPSLAQIAEDERK